MEKIRLTLCFGYFSSKSLSASYRYKYFEACYAIVGLGFQKFKMAFSCRNVKTCTEMLIIRFLPPDFPRKESLQKSGHQKRSKRPCK